jgi:hypothetical protein
VIHRHEKERCFNSKDGVSAQLGEVLYQVLLLFRFKAFCKLSIMKSDQHLAISILNGLRPESIEYNPAYDLVRSGSSATLSCRISFLVPEHISRAYRSSFVQSKHVSTLVGRAKPQLVRALCEQAQFTKLLVT